MAVPRRRANVALVLEVIGDSPLERVEILVAHLAHFGAVHVAAYAACAIHEHLVLLWVHTLGHRQVLLVELVALGTQCALEVPHVVLVRVAQVDEHRFGVAFPTIAVEDLVLNGLAPLLRREQVAAGVAVAERQALAASGHTHEVTLVAKREPRERVRADLPALDVEASRAHALVGLTGELSVAAGVVASPRKLRVDALLGEVYATAQVETLLAHEALVPLDERMWVIDVDEAVEIHHLVALLRLAASALPAARAAGGQHGIARAVGHVRCLLARCARHHRPP
mmetsp:Transcript_6045/g.23951  ORF Transcript_6045/g.23951 Transcript_6045/m.23951 type:complete len:283 (+) Transcript_6045:2447-3295(+)